MQGFRSNSGFKNSVFGKNKRKQQLYQTNTPKPNNPKPINKPARAERTNVGRKININ